MRLTVVELSAGVGWDLSTARSRSSGLGRPYCPIATRAVIAAGSGSQLASTVTICTAMRHISAATGRWSRFETKSAMSAAMIISETQGSPMSAQALRQEAA